MLESPIRAVAESRYSWLGLFVLVLPNHVAQSDSLRLIKYLRQMMNLSYGKHNQLYK